MYDVETSGMTFTGAFASNATLGIPPRYAGKERDTESGNDYFLARYYGSSMGRFLTPDPSGLYFADQSNPQSFNQYAYVLNNTLINTDPTGLDCAYFNDDNSLNYIKSGDCASTDDNGYYIDATGVLDANLDDDGNLVSYQTAYGTYFANGTEIATLIVDANGSTSPQPTAGEAFADFIISSVPGWTSDAAIAQTPLLFLAVNPYRFFSTHYCGPGGGGSTTGALDSACKTHDDGYTAAHITTANNLPGGPAMSSDQAAAATACNQALYDAARKNNNSPGSKAVQYWLTHGGNLPFGYLLQPGTEAKPW